MMTYLIYYKPSIILHAQDLIIIPPRFRLNFNKILEFIKGTDLMMMTLWL